MPKWVEVEIEGRVYENMMEAWKAESPPGLPYSTVSTRRDRGWPLIVALLAIPEGQVVKDV